MQRCDRCTVMYPVLEPTPSTWLYGYGGLGNTDVVTLMLCPICFGIAANRPAGDVEDRIMYAINAPTEGKAYSEYGRRVMLRSFDEAMRLPRSQWGTVTSMFHCAS